MRRATAAVKAYQHPTRWARKKARGRASLAAERSGRKRVVAAGEHVRR
jgi:hypothetical protein